MGESHIFSPLGYEVPFVSQRGCCQSKSSRMKRFFPGRKNRRKEEVDSTFRRKANIGSIAVLKKCEEKLFNEMLTPHSLSRIQAKKEKR